MTEQPLAGLAIAVTRPAAQAAGLVERIAALGGRPILFPLLEILPAADPAALHAQAARLAAFDWAIFISPNAVQYGMAAVRAALGGWPAQVRVAAVGQGSARALRAAGITEILAPVERFDSEALLALPEMHRVEERRMAIFRGDGGRELLADTLRVRGAQVEYLACYQRRKPTQSGADLLAAAPDVLTVTSSEALGYLWNMLDTEQQQYCVRLPLFVPHPRIADKALELGFRYVQATDGGDDGLLAGLVRWALHDRPPHN